MKNIIISIMILLLISFYPNSLGFAHSYTKSSSPAEGEVITSPLDTIEIIFETDVEKMGQLSLKGPNETIQVQNVTIEGDTLIGQLETPLENGQYEANWKIDGEDGHPIDATIAFSVNLPVQEQVQTEMHNNQVDPLVTEEQTDEEESSNSTTSAKNGSLEKEKKEARIQTTNEKNEGTISSNSFQTWLLAIMVLGALVVTILIFRKDKK